MPAQVMSKFSVYMRKEMSQVKKLRKR